MRFRTQSGSLYEIREVQGEEVELRLTRFSEQPLYSRSTGEVLTKVVYDQKITHHCPIEVGNHFWAFGPGFQIASTEIVEVES
jgi:hypothetical protein